MLNIVMDFTTFTIDDWSLAQRSFMEDFESATIPVSLKRIWNREAEFRVLPVRDDQIKLVSIEAVTPGLGSGRRGMEWFLGLADQHQVGIRLRIEPFNYNASMPHEDDLRRWYGRMGFQRLHFPEARHTNEMLRKPQILRSFP